MLEVWLLGKLTLRLAGRTLQVRDRNSKGLALVAYLAATGAASRDKLADLLWSELPQDTARRNLRQRLYELKNQLPDDAVRASGESIALNEPYTTDLQAFNAALQTGDDEAAIALWRGTPFADLEPSGAQGFEEWVNAEREALTERYCAALRRAATAREAHGDLRGALRAHEQLLETDALQEFHQREAIRLLALLGEPEGALGRFERFQALLSAELDIAPLPQTAQLAQSIRHSLRDPRGGSGAEATRADINATLELRAPLVGRDAAWQQLEGARAGLTLILGVPGIGKTRLAEELVTHSAGRAGATWRVLRGREGSSGSPLYPVAETLRRALSDDPSWVDALEPVWRAECARLVPEIDPSSAPQPMPSIEGRVRFLEALARALCASVGAGGALVLDDLHWFDPVSLELTAHLARRAAAANLRLIATARTEELSSNESAAPILTDLKRDALLTRLPLEPLLERDVRALVQALSGGLDAPNFAHRLHDATAGNPFYLLETLRELHSAHALQIMPSGAWTTPFDALTSSYSELPIPATVRETVLQRVTRAGPATRRLLEAASLAGNGFTFAVLSSAVALSEWEGLEGLERAVNAQLIEPSAQVSGAYNFNHDLTRRALDDALNPDRRKLIHQKLAVTLEGINGPSAQIAEHFERGDLKSRAAKWRVKAGEEAARVYAYEQALEQYEKAIEDGLEGKQLIVTRVKKCKICIILGLKLNLEKEIAYFNGNLDFYDEETEINIEICKTEYLIYNYEYKRSIRNYQEFLKKGFKFSDYLAEYFLLIALCFEYIGKYIEAREVLNQILNSKQKTSSSIIEKTFERIYNFGIAQEKRNLNVQTDIDLIKNEENFSTNNYNSLEKYSRYLQLRHEIDLAIDNFINLLKNSQNTRNIKLQKQALISLTNILVSVGKFTESKDYIIQGIHISEKTNDLLYKAAFNCNYLQYLHWNGDIDEQMRVSEETTNLFSECNAPYFLLNHIIHYCIRLNEIGAIEKSVDLIEKGRSIAQRNEFFDMERKLIVPEIGTLMLKKMYSTVIERVLEINDEIKILDYELYKVLLLYLRKSYYYSNLYEKFSHEELSDWIYNYSNRVDHFCVSILMNNKKSILTTEDFYLIADMLKDERVNFLTRYRLIEVLLEANEKRNVEVSYKALLNKRNEMASKIVNSSFEKFLIKAWTL